MISCLLIYTLFTLLFVYYQKYQFMEARGENVVFAKRMWHRLGMTMRLVVIVGLILPMLPALAPTFQDMFVTGALNILVWEMGINKIALVNVSIWHIGESAGTDKFFSKHKWKVYFGILAIAILVKIFT